MNGNNFSEKTTDFITLDEHGKVVVQDDNLAKISEELTLEELEKVPGAGNYQCTNNINNGCKQDCGKSS